MSRDAAGRAGSGMFRFGATLGALVTSLALGCGDSTAPPRATALGLATQPPTTAKSGVAPTQAPVAGTTTQTTDAAGRTAFSELVIGGTVGPRTLRFSAGSP